MVLFDLNEGRQNGDLVNSLKMSDQSEGIKIFSLKYARRPKFLEVVAQDKAFPDLLQRKIAIQRKEY